VIECACGAEDADGAPFFVVKMDTTYQGEAVTNESFSSLGVRGKYAEMMKTLAKSVATSVEEIQVKVRRLDTVLQEHAGDVCEIDLVCVDVEGWELEVLGGLTFEKYRPKVLIVENLFLEKAYVEFLEERGYRLWRRIEPNDVFVRRDWRGGAERTQHRGSDG
jgi:FkbM family methyltransferase